MCGSSDSDSHSWGAGSWKTKNEKLRCGKLAPAQQLLPQRDLAYRKWCLRSSHALRGVLPHHSWAQGVACSLSGGLPSCPLCHTTQKPWLRQEQLCGPNFDPNKPHHGALHCTLSYNMVRNLLVLMPQGPLPREQKNKRKKGNCSGGATITTRHGHM